MQPLSVQLGPGILGNIFDGIQRPLKAIAVRSGDVFIPRGVAVPALDETAAWEFAPTGFKVRCKAQLYVWFDQGSNMQIAAAAVGGMALMAGVSEQGVRCLGSSASSSLGSAVVAGSLALSALAVYKV